MNQLPDCDHHWKKQSRVISTATHNVRCQSATQVVETCCVGKPRVGTGLSDVFLTVGRRQKRLATPVWSQMGLAGREAQAREQRTFPPSPGAGRQRQGLSVSPSPRPAAPGCSQTPVAPARWPSGTTAYRAGDSCSAPSPQLTASSCRKRIGTARGGSSKGKGETLLLLGLLLGAPAHTWRVRGCGPGRGASQALLSGLQWGREAGQRINPTGKHTRRPPRALRAHLGSQPPWEEPQSWRCGGNELGRELEVCLL